MNCKKNQKRRAVSEVIATVLLLGITVVGAVFVMTFFQESEIMEVGKTVTQSTQNMGTNISFIKLVGYDTRDSTCLSGIGDCTNVAYPDLDNSFNQITTEGNGVLCALTCAGVNDDIPTNGGTEFIVLTIRNVGVQPVTIIFVGINNVDHSWDGIKSGNALNIVGGGSFPDDGTFSIIHQYNDVAGAFIQQSDAVIDSGETVRLVIKLSDTIDDIPISQPLNVFIGTDKIDSSNILISSGATT